MLKNCIKVRNLVTHTKLLQLDKYSSQFLNKNNQILYSFLILYKKDAISKFEIKYLPILNYKI